MSDNPTPDVEPTSNPVEGNLTEEISSLGKNLIGILRAAWERPERQKLQQEIEGGLSDLSNTLRKEAKAVSDNQVTQKVKTEVEDLSYRVRSGQVESKVRSELVGALHIVNTELQKVADILSASEKEADKPPTNTTVAGDGPDEAAPVETPAEQAEPENSATGPEDAEPGGSDVPADASAPVEGA